MLNPYFKKDYLKKQFESKLLNSKSKGIDKISAHQAHNNNLIDFSLLSKKYRSKTYKYSPYLELLRVKKRDSPPRLISIPCIRDKITLLAIKDFLHDKFSERVKRRLPNSFIRQIKNYINTCTGAEIYFLKLDIQNFYGEIDHKILFKELNKKKLPVYVQELINKAITNPTVPANYQKINRHKYATSKGIPQGLSISNIIAEIYLTQIDLLFEKRNYLYVRYVDDIFILTKSNRIPQIEKSLKQKLSEVFLKINPDKTSQGKLALNQSITFLGYNIFKNKISISQDNFQKIISKITDKIAWLKKCIVDPSYRPDWITDTKRVKEIFIEEINERITGAKHTSRNYGWLFYFIETEDIDQLFKLDSIIDDLIDNTKVFRKRPKIKRFVRAFYEIKYNKGGNYIVNYDNIKTIRQKRIFLIKRGKLNPMGYYSDIEIERKYDQAVRRNIKHLEKDINYNYL